MLQPNDYKIVVQLVFPNGNENYVIWEPLLYARMIEVNTDFYDLFYNTPDAIKSPPLEVHIYLYLNPTLREISQKIGSNTFIQQLLVGKKICLISSY